MKLLKRIIGVFFILSTLISVSFLSSACENESPNKEPSIIAETNTGKYLNEEENTESPMEEGEQKIYISYLSIPEIIYLSNNGVGIDFIVNYLPKNTTENIYINIDNSSVINFASEISEENRKT